MSLRKARLIGRIYTFSPPFDMSFSFAKVNNLAEESKGQNEINNR